MTRAEQVAGAYRAVHEHITAAAGRDVTVVAVAKGFPIADVEAVVAAGCHDVGESYAQEAVAKLAGPARLGSAARVHFVGRLQSNKVRGLASVVHVWQSVDRDALVDEIARRAPGAEVLVQVNPLGERGKGGCRPAAAADLVARAAERGLRVGGLMVIGPTDADPVATREAFRTVRALADDLGLATVSMGMSGDWPIAVDEGATHLRIGTAIFGPRPAR